jgi:menaquinone-dependent protoporphyrinogen oxidase
VIGSAIYYGSWIKEATDWVNKNQSVLANRPVWLFTRGPLGTEVEDDEQQPREIADFQKLIKPRDHRIFFGSLDLNKLSFTERTMLKAVHAHEGDYRDWKAIDAWAESIVRDLGNVKTHE